jgi:predicted DNA-binding transcriptional regulator AlpA
MAATRLGLNSMFVVHMRAVIRVTGLCRSTNYRLAIQPNL